MTDDRTIEAALSSELAAFFTETPWQTALASRDGTLLALSQPLLDFLSASADMLVGTPIELLVRESERAALAALFDGMRRHAVPNACRAHLLQHNRRAVAVEIELFPLQDDREQRVAVEVYPISMMHRREQILLEFNRLAPQLLVAQSAADLFATAGQSLKPLGLGLLVATLEPDQAALRIEYLGLQSGLAELLRRVARLDLDHVRIPHAAPYVSEVLKHRMAVFTNDFRALIHVAIPPGPAAIVDRLRQLSGIPGFILAPLLAGVHVRGVLMVWSHVLNAEHVPFVEAFAHQLAAVLAQIELRAQMQRLSRSEHEQQRQRHELTMLLNVSQAVNSSLDLDTILQAGLGAIEDLDLATTSAVILLTGDRLGTISRARPDTAPALLAAHNLILGDSQIVNDICSGRLVRVSDAQFQTRVHSTGQGQALPPFSAILLPLIADGQTLGSLKLGRVGGQDYADREVELLQTIAAQLAQAIAKANVHAALRATAQDNARLYREAEEARSYLNALVRNTPDLLLTIRRDMMIHVLNPDRLGSSGRYTAASVEGQSFLKLAPEPMRPELLNIWRQVLSGRAQSFELELAKADRSPLFVLFSAALIADYGEVFVIIKDVTEQRQREVYARQNEKLAALGGLVAGAAHELNNPLAAILGLAQLQLSADHAAELRADLVQIERAALQAGAIVQQLVRFASPQLSQTQPLAIAPLIDATLARVAQSLLADAIESSVELAPDLPLVTGNPDQLEHLLFNLVYNAVQALAQLLAGQRRAIAIRAQQDGQMLRVSIADTGPGIAQEHVLRIFDPFFTTRVVGRGAGLGLAISHAIVQQHGGRIWVHSPPSQGATFIFELPISDQS